MKTKSCSTSKESVLAVIQSSRTMTFIFNFANMDIDFLTCEVNLSLAVLSKVDFTAGKSFPCDVFSLAKAIKRGMPDLLAGFETVYQKPGKRISPLSVWISLKMLGVRLALVECPGGYCLYFPDIFEIRKKVLKKGVA